MRSIIQAIVCASHKSVMLRRFMSAKKVNMSKHTRYFVNIYHESEQKLKDSGDFRESLKNELKSVIDRINRKVPPERATLDGGLYVGSAGIAYAFLHLSQRATTLSAEYAKDYLNLAHRYLRESLNYVERRGHRLDCAFLLGDAGIIAVGAVVVAASGENELAASLAKRYVALAEPCKKINFLDCGSDELFVGRAGYLFGALWLNRQLRKEVVPIVLMHELCQITVDSGKKYSKHNKSPCPLMYSYYGTEYLGAAHGLSAILQILIQTPGFLDFNKEAEILVRESVEYLLSIESDDGNFPCAMDELDRYELVHWCHGSPGVVYLMAAAYLRWKNQRYLDSCLKAGELIWHKGLLRKGPGICHGVAGSGYVFLLLYRLTSDRTHLYRAAKFAEFMTTSQFLNEARTPDSPFSLYEGYAGTACFLADLCEPEKAAFPFQDVF